MYFSVLVLIIVLELVGNSTGWQFFRSPFWKFYDTRKDSVCIQLWTLTQLFSGCTVFVFWSQVMVLQTCCSTLHHHRFYPFLHDFWECKFCPGYLFCPTAPALCDSIACFIPFDSEVAVFCHMATIPQGNEKDHLLSCSIICFSSCLQFTLLMISLMKWPSVSDAQVWEWCSPEVHIKAHLLCLAAVLPHIGTLWRKILAQGMGKEQGWI